jgi:RsiW-degrading membrane proteinase PrsW (M82 family)
MNRGDASVLLVPKMEQNHEANRVGTPTISIPVATALGTSTTSTTTAATSFPVPNQNYKGFSTSICDLFHTSDPLHKEDCCAFACCGILARERNAFFRKYLLRAPHNGTNSSTVAPVLLMLVLLIPLLLLLPQITLLLVFLFLLASCYYRYEQTQFRRQLTDPNWLLPSYRTFIPPQITATTTTSGQDSYDANCAHSICCCGWYTRDDDDHGDYRSVLTDNYHRDKPDLCTVLWRWLSDVCCGACFCRCWFQCCGCCAVAQETRQIQLLLPTEITHVDYITHQKYDDYYSKIQHLRAANKKSFIQHFTQGISKLSQGLIVTLTFVILLIYILDLLGQLNQKRHSTITEENSNNNNYYYTYFPFSHLLVFLATFLQPFFVLLLVHWLWNRMDLSVDAVIKYFASGFILTTSLAMFIELLVSTAIQLVLSILVLVGGNKVFLSLLYLMLNAYISAAFVEELCKYFGFWMVVHPDFCTLTRHQRGRSNETALELSTEETPLMATATNNTLTTGNNLEEPLLVVATTAISSTATSSQTVYDRSYKSLGCAITIAMITVSLGFACCENLLYVFVYSPQNESITVQLSILGMRSIFPIHPLAAAIQSIGVCKRDLEGDPTVGIGQILLPSVLLHGTFDFSLLLLSWISQSSDQDRNKNEQTITTLTLVVSLLCLGVSISVVFIGLCYYYKVG